MVLSSKTLGWIIVLIIGIGLIVFGSLVRNVKNPVALSPTPKISFSVSPAPSRSSLPATKTPAPTNKMGPATCQIGGSINFISKNLYETKGAKIVYQNVDDPARLVFWKIAPDDGSLKVGPNIFSGLQLPNGERAVGVTPIKDFSADLYTLTASISYGVTDSRDVERIHNAACAGLITVTAPPK